MLKAKKEGTLIAIDYGLKRIGIACGDTSLKIAHPLATLHVKTRKERWQALEKIQKEWQPIAWIVGLTLLKDGKEGLFTPVCRNFAVDLKEKSQLPVYLVNEYSSSNDAGSHLNERESKKTAYRQHLDEVSALIILQSYFSDGALLSI